MYKQTLQNSAQEDGYFQIRNPSQEPKEENLIAAVSKTFTKTERNYSIYKKEALALLYTLRAMDFYLRFAPKLIILIDSKALTFLRLAKDASDILLRFSLEISKYEAEIHHIPGTDNEISDMLSRQHEEIPQIEAEIKTNKTISVKDSVELLNAMTLPQNLHLTKSQLFNLLNGPSPIDDTNTKPRPKSKAMLGPKSFKNVPTTLHNRKIKMPRTTSNPRRPGVLLKTNVLTRSKAKIQPEETNRPIVMTSDIETPSPAPSTSDEHSTEDTQQITPQDQPLASQNTSRKVNYSDIAEQVTITQKGFLTPHQFFLAQINDEYISQQIATNAANLDRTDGIYKKKIKDKYKPMLPNALAIILINSHHFQPPAIHKSTAQIIRDIQNIYAIPKETLKSLTNEIIQNCHICQLYTQNTTSQPINNLTRQTLPRMSWSLDLITDLPLSTNNYKLLLICVDDFSNFSSRNSTPYSIIQRPHSRNNVSSTYAFRKPHHDSHRRTTWNLQFQRILSILH